VSAMRVPLAVRWFIVVVMMLTASTVASAQDSVSVAVLPFVPDADVTAAVIACAGKTSASAETRGSAYCGCMETSVGCSIHGSIGPHPHELPAPMGRSASVVVLGGPLAEAYARLFCVGRPTRTRERLDVAEAAIVIVEVEDRRELRAVRRVVFDSGLHVFSSCVDGLRW